MRTRLLPLHNDISPPMPSITEILKSGGHYERVIWHNSLTLSRELPKLFWKIVIFLPQWSQFQALLTPPHKGGGRLVSKPWMDSSCLQYSTPPIKIVSLRYALYYSHIPCLVIQPSTLGWELSLKTLGGVIIRWNQKFYSIANNAAQHVNWNSFLSIC